MAFPIIYAECHAMHFTPCVMMDYLMDRSTDLVQKMAKIRDGFVVTLIYAYFFIPSY